MTTEIEQVKSEALEIPEQAQAVNIVDSATYQEAGNILVAIKGIRKKINATFDPIIKAAHTTHKEAVAQKKTAEAPLVEAENIIKPALGAWDTQQENIRLEEERKRQAQARKAEEERQLAEAVALEEQGEKEAADEVMAEPVHVAPVIIPKTVPKVQGISYQVRWKFRITDESKIPRGYLTPDTVKIGQAARMMKGACDIPGVQTYSEKGVSGTG